ncbi:hypothetical protein SAMN03080615_01952 [Amphritea atlantica]|uniref:Uncharacterized protein n=1 Tax=Amphritea atlantica TaxID=355243 RepID=A0A1H9H5G9_9GAMM|nr:hypothetical protein [Amphritea atlantica]SEQ57584.1 hypothetical protein SAMN03080615_01952 [Amphritea atlantica]
MKVKVFLFLSVFTLSLLLLAFFTPLVDFYKFSDLCRKDGGLTIYEKLDSGVGWLADDYFSSLSDVYLKDVGFSRFKDIDGNFYDVIYVGGDRFKSSSFKKIKFNSEYDAIYYVDVGRKTISEKSNIGVYRSSYKRISDDKVMAVYNNYYIDLLREGDLFFGVIPSVYTCSGGYKFFYSELGEMFK